MPKNYARFTFNRMAATKLKREKTKPGELVKPRKCKEKKDVRTS